jgi:hypothetical protein
MTKLPALPCRAVAPLAMICQSVDFGNLFDCAGDEARED